MEENVYPSGFLLRPAYVPVGAALVVGTAYSFSPQFGSVWFVLGLLVASVWLFRMFVRIASAAKHRLWRRAISLFAIFVCVWPVMGAALFAGDYIHLGLAYPFYEMAIERSSDGQAKPMTFRWSGIGFAGSASTGRSVVHDASGETALRLGRKEVPDYPGVLVNTRHLLGNFYLVELEMGN
jgi:hypothetical protein